jgi:hypothetical protein
MDPERYHALKENIQLLSQTAIRTTIPEGTNRTTMKNRIHRRAAEQGMPVTVRKILGDLLCWRSTAEDLHQAQPVVVRLQPAPQPPQAAQRSRRRHALSTSIMRTVTTALRNQYDDHPPARRHMVW